MFGLFNSTQALKSPLLQEALRREPEIKMILSFCPLLITCGSLGFYEVFLIPEAVKVGKGGGSFGWNFSK